MEIGSRFRARLVAPQSSFLPFVQRAKSTAPTIADGRPLGANLENEEGKAPATGEELTSIQGWRALIKIRPALGADGREI